MITVKNRDELIEILGADLCITAEETKFEKWLENNTNLQQFVCELNKVWDDYSDLIYPKIQQIVDNTDFRGDWNEI